MASILLAGTRVLQTALSGYVFYLSCETIGKMQQYESKSEKAAQYSNVAEDQLWKTRYTLASVTMASIFSLSSNALPLLLGPGMSNASIFAFAAVNAVVLIAARSYNAGFWQSKAKIPGVSSYNESISHTTELRLFMGYMVGVSALQAIVGLLV